MGEFIYLFLWRWANCLLLGWVDVLLQHIPPLSISIIWVTTNVLQGMTQSEEKLRDPSVNITGEWRPFDFHLQNLAVVLASEDQQSLSTLLRIGKIWVAPYIIILKPSICGLLPYLSPFIFVDN